MFRFRMTSPKISNRLISRTSLSIPWSRFGIISFYSILNNPLLLHLFPPENILYWESIPQTQYYILVFLSTIP